MPALLPISPNAFYNLPPGPPLLSAPQAEPQDLQPPPKSLPEHVLSDHNDAIDPSLASTRVVNSEGSANTHSTPSEGPRTSDPQDTGGKAKRKARKEFSGADIDALLRAVIEVNPYIAQRSQVMARWVEVTKRVQANGACLGRNADTLKNKVKSLLEWVQKGSQKNARCPLGREAENDPANFASISGKLDKVESMRLEAAEVKESKKMRAEESQKAKEASAQGAAMRDAMMVRHATSLKQKEVPDDAEDVNAEENKENEVIEESPNTSALPSRSPSLMDGSGGKRSRYSGTRRGNEDTHESELVKLQRRVLEEQVRANEFSVQRQEANDRNYAALLAVLQEGLLGGGSS